MRFVDDKSRYRLIIATVVMVTVGVLAFLLIIGINDAGAGEYLLFMMVIAAVILLLPFVLLLRMRRDVKKGFPLEDERGRAVKQRAGYYAFMATIYIVQAFLYYEFIFVDIFEAPALRPTEYFLVLDMVILGVYMAFWWWFSKKGDLSG
jgi:hypothetical protein